jgi:hypothetical protein
MNIDRKWTLLLATLFLIAALLVALLFLPIRLVDGYAAVPWWYRGVVVRYVDDEADTLCYILYVNEYMEDSADIDCMPMKDTDF